MTKRTSIAAAFTAEEIACAAGVEMAVVLEELGVGADRHALVPRAGAIRLVRLYGRPRLSDESGRPVVGPVVPAALFAAPTHMKRVAGGLAAAAALHIAFVTSVLLIAAAGGGASPALAQASERLEPLRLVYLAIPGPGGGGGGGGRRDRAPAPKAERLGHARVSSPLPATRPVPVAAPVVPPPEPPAQVPAAEPLPPVFAPVVPVPGDGRDRAGVVAPGSADADSRGPGAGGGAGSGSGTGIGEGNGQGVGPGSDGGTGGGPFRPGSGVEPPTVLREVKPTYTDAARQRGLTGEVVLEVLVHADGSARVVRVIQGIGSGLDERAIEAVRQWRFSPARRLGQPVDVLVEVAVEFRLR